MAELTYETEITRAVESFRDAKRHGGGEIARWQPVNMSADRAILRDAGTIRARARDLVRNNPFAKNAVRMNRDAVSGAGVKLALKIDWRSLGIKDIEAAAEWQLATIRAWEAYAESFDFDADARRMRTFSDLFALVDTTDYVDGECVAVLELKPGIGPYATCVNLVDVDRLSNPMGVPDSETIRGGIERDPMGEPIAYHIRNGHPADVGLSFGQFTWQRVPRRTPWGRWIVLHTFDHDRPEQSRGVSAFATAITPMKMLSTYGDTELRSAITQAGYAAVIKTELDWSKAFDVIGQKARSAGTTVGGNGIVDMMLGSMAVASEYHNDRDITFEGVKIPHLLPNESLEVLRATHPNSNFADFESAFVRQLAAGLGVEAHELGKNYKEVNYSAARAALLAVWRTYRARRSRIVKQFGMPHFGAWLEEAVALGMVPLPPGVTNFLAAKPYLVRGTFIAWGKPMIDPMKERQAQQLSVQMGIETIEEITADEGLDWRDTADQVAFERNYYHKLGIPHPTDNILPPLIEPPAPPTDDGG